MFHRLLSDVDLLSRLQSDDQQALLLLMKKYDRQLFRHIYHKTRSTENAQEAVQDIFISLWNNRYSLVITDSLLPYLFKAAKHKALDFYINNSREIISYEALLPEYDHLLVMPPDEAVTETELQVWLANEVEKMPENVKKSFQLSRQEHLPVRDIAQKLSLSEQTVRNNLSIAVKHLMMRFKRMESSLFLIVLIRIWLSGR
ncbi:sigma-70 family RNA polymerase sigma factor [Mucilaginibacter sp. Bleaf8]|uniref:RNA polymerase sigma factor n=1 Tax=Mucilaginibacter sp. Bleaf8 TaxID=2834430 RepID=UPI001BD0CCF3|nr:sigma-70 family RNA polymerase sigma factor [Mucilaginibacter sp. Bleaf8]MBS7563879.1 sigma-70 family RNA polymerase sigma factor [Mucilaginibacter sp. Bleaf8]